MTAHPWHALALAGSLAIAACGDSGDGSLAVDATVAQPPGDATLGDAAPPTGDDAAAPASDTAAEDRDAGAPDTTAPDSATADSQQGDTTVAPDTTPAPTGCDGGGFADSPLHWAIPYPTGEFANWYHTVADLDGDALPDFVEFDGEAPGAPEGVGVSHWRVYRNTGAGFAAAPRDWPIPYPADLYSNEFHTVIQLDGDSLPDFVEFDAEAPGSPPSVGQTEWRVYTNSATGFAASPTSWAIPYPAPELANAFHTIADLDGDGRPDFVEFDGEAADAPPSVGQSQWRVYRNTGSGFAASPLSWPIPYPADTFANAFHTVMDMDGDGLPDFVAYDQEAPGAPAAVGTTQWHVYRNTGSGFAASPTPWAIPYPADVLANAYHTVADMTGDRRLDFVEFDGEAPGSPATVGSAIWRVYANRGDGFEATARAWTIPYPADLFSNAFHTVVDLDGDRLPDYVQFDVEFPEVPAAVSQTRWEVHRGGCD